MGILYMFQNKQVIHEEISVLSDNDVLILLWP